MKNVTIKGINTMTFGEKSRLAHAMAKNLEGVYSVRLAMAWNYIKGGKVATINALINPTTTNISKAIIEYKGEKATKKESSKRVKKAVKRIDTIETKSHTIYFDGLLPVNILKSFPEEYSTLTILVKKHVDYKNKNGASEMDVQLFHDGLEALKNVQTFQELQATMLVYFMNGMAKYMIWKHLEFGAGYKKLNKKDSATIQAENSYMNASSNSGKITTHEVDDVFNQLVIDAYTKTFDENMFKDERFVNPALFFRISNVMRTELRRLKHQTKFRLDKETGEIIGDSRESVSSEAEAMNEAKSLNVFTDEELAIIEYRINGYKKNEIDKIVGQRTDRKFTAIKKKWAEVN